VEGDRPAALLAIAELTGRTGSSHLRRQLTAWAREQLLNACRSRQGAEAAYHRYELLATAGTHEGALEVAVARMSSPALDDSPQSVRALLEQAQETLAALTAARTAAPDFGVSSPATATPAGPAVKEPAPAGPAKAADTTTTEAPAKQTRPAPQAPAPVATAHAAPAPAPAPGIVGTPVSLSDPEFVQVLNVVGRSSARAAAVLRRCAVARDGGGKLVFTVPADMAERAADVALLDVLRGLVDAGALPQAAPLP
jgi:hypothetical protein